VAQKVDTVEKKGCRKYPKGIPKEKARGPKSDMLKKKDVGNILR